MTEDRKLISVFSTFAALMIGLAIMGAFRAYSPVPYLDMWDAYVNFFNQVLDGGGVHPWWAQHNEHRLVLTRLFVWADLAWLGGAVWPLIVVIYCFVFAGAFAIWLMLRELTGTEKPDANEVVLGFFILACLYLWVQYENLTFAVQIQCVLAQLLPLCALYLLHKSVIAIHSGRYFVLACGFGAASVGTMANGTLALPLMTLYALLTRQGKLRIGTLAALSVASILAYFHDYQAPAYHGQIAQALMETPIAFAEYVLLYLGSPFFYLFGGSIGKVVPGLGAVGIFINGFAKLVAILAGLFLIASSARLALRSLQQPRASSLTLALLFFIVYVGGTAFGTAGGRLIFGVDQALSSRYTTPALMAWCALLVLYSPRILAAIGAREKTFLIPLSLLMLVMLVLQFFALRSQDIKLFERKVAALALELQVRDEMQIVGIYPDLGRVLDVAERASTRNISIFGMYPYRDARQSVGVSVLQATGPPCQGSLDQAEAIDGDARFVRVSGWIFDPSTRSYPDLIRFLDRQGRIVGYAFTGRIRTDMADAIDKNALHAGFKGYLLADQRGSMLSLQGENPSCQIKLPVPTH